MSIHDGCADRPSARIMANLRSIPPDELPLLAALVLLAEASAKTALGRRVATLYVEMVHAIATDPDTEALEVAWDELMAALRDTDNLAFAEVIAQAENHLSTTDEPT